VQGTVEEKKKDANSFLYRRRKKSIRDTLGNEKALCCKKIWNQLINTVYISEGHRIL
jgi:hypothetical protein